MKTEIFNLIILDESGSMGHLKASTISGCNETLNTIRSAQENFAETQNHYVSIYVFQSNDSHPSHYIIKNVPIAKVVDINEDQYMPWGGTPLYDAIGSTLVDLKANVTDKEFAIGNVTIITDGMENSSSHYTREKIAKMIDALKEMGWSFNFIGANIDVKGTANSLHIDNSLEFDHSAEGTRTMFVRERNSRMAWARRTDEVLKNMKGKCVDRASFSSDMKDASANYFDLDDKDDLV